MPRILASLTCVALLAHPFFGCCWNHEHATKADGESTPIASAHEHAHHHAHHHGHHHAPAPREDSSHNDHDSLPCQAPHDCDGGQCLFVGPQTVRTIGPSGDLPASSYLALVPATPRVEGAQATLGFGERSAQRFDDGCYLQLGVLLL